MQDACQTRHPMTGVSHAVQTTTQATHEENMMQAGTTPEKLLNPRPRSTRFEDRYMRKQTCDRCNEPTLRKGILTCQQCADDAEEDYESYN